MQQRTDSDSDCLIYHHNIKIPRITTCIQFRELMIYWYIAGERRNSYFIKYSFILVSIEQTQLSSQMLNLDT